MGSESQNLTEIENTINWFQNLSGIAARQLHVVINSKFVKGSQIKAFKKRNRSKFELL